MAKKILLLIYSVCIVFFIQCNEKKTSEKDKEISISGKVISKERGMAKLVRLNTMDGLVIDSVKIKDDGTFEFKVKVGEPDYYQIEIEELTPETFILNDTDLHIQINSDKDPIYDIEGSKDTDNLNKIIDLQVKFQEKSWALSNEYLKAEQGADKEKMEEIQQQYDTLAQEHIQTLMKNVDQMLPSIAVFQAVQTLDLYEKDQFKHIIKFAEKVNKSIPDLEVTKRFNKELDHAIAEKEKTESMALSEGDMAPEIKLPDPNGNTIALSSLRGKWVLIDFWASWCGPCRKESPFMVQLYDQFKGKDFEIYSVSLDKDRESWLKAIENDHLDWLHVSDLKFWESAAAEAYGVRAIPATFLIDKNGVIAAVNLRGKELENKIKALLNE